MDHLFFEKADVENGTTAFSIKGKNGSSVSEEEDVRALKVKMDICVFEEADVMENSTTVYTLYQW